MGSVVFTDDMEAFLNPSSIKVYPLMCTTLINIVSKASRILAAIESTRPRCTSGMESLCSLNKAIEELKSIINQCTQSSPKRRHYTLKMHTVKEINGGQPRRHTKYGSFIARFTGLYA
ncbi:unnamed protein product [Cuscuta europaea]|uniref:Uncharacterized protein n=1 Tax=Cuscuta europaea TaxID=41803 RepID=A0A9P0ZJU6_CUSEU|nr:unnamed protein product [Cuscuta europaea]